MRYRRFGHASILSFSLLERFQKAAFPSNIHIHSKKHAKMPLKSILKTTFNIKWGTAGNIPFFPIDRERILQDGILHKSLQIIQIKKQTMGFGL
ncbi:hypothetical protein LJC24_01120 [Desulfococcaceae bacterium OttesenSCG-928-F15]|nr:hypothetical protein [Desulfococcaceae bacterium OttesenSCG-928-F15]